MATITQQVVNLQHSGLEGEIFLGTNTHIKKETSSDMLVLTGGTGIVQIDSGDLFTYNNHRIYHEGNTTVNSVEPTASDGVDGDIWWVIE